MVAVTRSKCALNHACRFLGLSSGGRASSHYRTELREHIKQSQNVTGNDFKERHLPDVTVHAEAIEPEPSVPSSCYSSDNIGYLSSVMEGIIKGVRDSPFRHRCVMVGGYPTFLLGKTDKFNSVDFLFVHQPQADNVSFFIQFANVLARHLSPDKEWFFEACCEEPDNNYSIKMHDIRLRENAHMMLATKARGQGHINKMTFNTLTLSFKGIRVANFCLVSLSSGEKKRLTENGEMAIESCEEQLINHNTVTKFVINNIYDSDFVMVAAYFGGHGDTRLCCVDVSFKRLIDQVDNKYMPIHYEKRANNYGCRVSGSFKRHVKALRKLVC